MTRMCAEKEALTVSVVDAARLLGISKNYAYSAIEAGTFPVRVIRIGNRRVIPRAELARALGVAELPPLGRGVRRTTETTNP